MHELPNDQHALEAVSLQQAVCARLCHDLNGPMATLSGLLDLAETPDAEALDLIRESSRAIRGRLQLASTALGGAGEAKTTGELRALLQHSSAAQRVSFDIEVGEGARPCPGDLAGLALNAALVGAEALPRGGAVRCAIAEDQVIVAVEGLRARWPAELMALVTAGNWAAGLLHGPRHVMGALLLAKATALGWDVQFGLPPASGIPTLILTKA